MNANGSGIGCESRQEFLMFHVKHDFHYDLLFLLIEVFVDIYLNINKFVLVNLLRG